MLTCILPFLVISTENGKNVKESLKYKRFNVFKSITITIEISCLKDKQFIDFLKTWMEMRPRLEK